MASIVRFAVPGVRRISSILPAMKRSHGAWYSSTSKKVEQSEYVVGQASEVDPKRVQEIIDEGKRAYDEQNDINSPYYLSWGFDRDNYMDLWSKRFTFFFGISIVCVLAPIYYHYLPDPKATKWAQAEAEILLRERREAGLPLIDPDFIPRDRIILPEDDVLAD